MKEFIEQFIKKETLYKDEHGGVTMGVDHLVMLLEKYESEQLILHPVICTSFDDVARPVMKYLAENHNPHTICVVEANYAELVVGVKSIKDDKYLVD